VVTGLFWPVGERNLRSPEERDQRRWGKSEDYTVVDHDPSRGRGDRVIRWGCGWFRFECSCGCFATAGLFGCEKFRGPIAVFLRFEIIFLKENRRLSLRGRLLVFLRAARNGFRVGTNFSDGKFPTRIRSRGRWVRVGSFGTTDDGGAILFAGAGEALVKFRRAFWRAGIGQGGRREGRALAGGRIHGKIWCAVILFRRGADSDS